MEITWSNSTSTDVFHFGEIANNDWREVVFGGNFIVFDTDVRIKKDNTGDVRWTVLYQ